MEKSMTGRQKLAVVLVSLIVLAVAATMLYINDYYHADNAAQQCITEPSGNVAVKDNGDGIYTFAPDDMAPQAGVIFYPGGKVEAESYAPLMTAIAERGITAVLVSMPANLAVLDKDAADGLCDDFPEIDEWYMAGHSLGGSMAAAYLGDSAGDFGGLILLGSYSTEDLSEATENRTATGKLISRQKNRLTSLLI